MSTKLGKKLVCGMKTKNENLAIEFGNAPPPLQKIELQNINDYLRKLLLLC